MAYPTIPYNASTGNDTVPTGNDGGGANADWTSTTITLSDGPFDLTGVADDGTDYVWFNGTAGTRHLGQITAFVGGVSTCTALTVAQAGPGESGKTWYVNGTRATFENDSSQPDSDDWVPGWTISVGPGIYTTAQDFYPSRDTAPTATSGPLRVIASGARPTIAIGASGADAFAIGISREVYFEGIKFDVTGGGISGYCQPKNASVLIARDCVFDGGGTAHSAILTGGYAIIRLIKCYFTGHTTAGLYFNTSHTASMVFVYGCTFNGGGKTYWSSAAISIADGLEGCKILHNLIYDSKNDGIWIQPELSTSYAIVGNTIVDNAGDGIALVALSDTRIAGEIINNVIAYNGAYGIIAGSASTFNWDDRLVVDFNAVYLNSTDDYIVITAGANAVTLTVDPFFDRSSDDYRIITGGECDGVGFPGVFPDGT